MVSSLFPSHQTLQHWCSSAQVMIQTYHSPQIKALLFNIGSYLFTGQPYQNSFKKVFNKIGQPLVISFMSLRVLQSSLSKKEDAKSRPNQVALIVEVLFFSTLISCPYSLPRAGLLALVAFATRRNFPPSFEILFKTAIIGTALSITHGTALSATPYMIKNYVNKAGWIETFFGSWQTHFRFSLFAKTIQLLTKNMKSYKGDLITILPFLIYLPLINKLKVESPAYFSSLGALYILVYGIMDRNLFETSDPFLEDCEKMLGLGKTKTPNTIIEHKETFLNELKTSKEVPQLNLTLSKISQDVENLTKKDCEKNLKFLDEIQNALKNNTYLDEVTYIFSNADIQSIKKKINDRVSEEFQRAK